MHIFEGCKLNWRHQQDAHLLQPPAPPLCGPPPHGTAATVLPSATPRRLSLGIYIIRNGQGFGLDQAIWEVHLDSFDVMLMTNTKITSEVYFHNHLGYDVVCFPAFNTATGGV